MTDPQQHAPAPQPPAAPPYGGGQGYPAPGYPAPGYGSPAAPGYGAPFAAAARPNGGRGAAVLALVFAGIAVLSGWMNTLGSFMAYRFHTPAWVFPVLGGLVIVVFDVLALVFGIIAARRGSGVKGGIAIGVAAVGLLGVLFSMMIPALYSTLMRV
ncbi:hypothetical protein [Microbacterium sp. MYb64]|uniref:hypothetical protein n=1 Tax=Microbacterium sp. MYb64 TaxID=1848691 RepID=UPI000CFDD21B|nr:hypothetical protein [Microbacterium sp. MYb64]PRB05036.1 hypothetical protein CQ044_10645 [Microbacterium sp. MYb64]